MRHTTGERYLSAQETRSTFMSWGDSKTCERETGGRGEGQLDGWREELRAESEGTEGVRFISCAHWILMMVLSWVTLGSGCCDFLRGAGVFSTFSQWPDLWSPRPSGSWAPFHIRVKWD